jgi:divalent metal cation (Fe/Co/Zn/Cd) transporter
LSGGQVAAGVFTHSYGLIADGIHSMTGQLSDAIVLLANHDSHQEADSQHPYGRHRFETAASLVLGILLLMVGGGMMLRSVQSVKDPSTIATVSQVALWAAGVRLLR